MISKNSHKSDERRSQPDQRRPAMQWYRGPAYEEEIYQRPGRRIRNEGIAETRNLGRRFAANSNLELAMTNCGGWGEGEKEGVG